VGGPSGSRLSQLEAPHDSALSFLTVAIGHRQAEHERLLSFACRRRSMRFASVLFLLAAVAFPSVSPVQVPVFVITPEKSTVRFRRTV
jgi:hypothetical protein